MRRHALLLLARRTQIIPNLALAYSLALSMVTLTSCGPPVDYESLEPTAEGVDFLERSDADASDSDDVESNDSSDGDSIDSSDGHSIDSSDGNSSDSRDAAECPNGENDCELDGLCEVGPNSPDGDGDGVPDRCDICAGHDDNADDDGDTVPDGCDVCPHADDLDDADEDGLPDLCDCDNDELCHSNAFCTPLEDGDYLCDCLPGFQGDGFEHCDNINECQTAPCAPGADCEDIDGGFHCRCPHGTQSEDPFFTQCADIDACAESLDDCDPAATCQSGPMGSWSCSCPAVGYHDVNGDGTLCGLVDACEEGLHDCDPVATCRRRPVGTWTCRCPSDGYEDTNGDGTTCREIDECTEGGHDCSELAECENTLGGWTCECPTGYEGDATGRTGCIDIDECAAEADNCDPQVTCDGLTPAGSWTCGACPNGFSGGGTTDSPCVEIDECDLDLDDCDEQVTCDGLAPAGSWTCGACPNLYSGGGTLNDPCLPPITHNGGFDNDLGGWTVSDGVSWNSVDHHELEASGAVSLQGPAHQYASQCVSVCDGSECASQAEAVAWVFSPDSNLSGRAMLQIETYSEADCEGDSSGRQTTANGRPQTNEWLLKATAHVLPEGTESIMVIVSAWASSGDYSASWDDITLELH